MTAAPSRHAHSAHHAAPRAMPDPSAILQTHTRHSRVFRPTPLTCVGHQRPVVDVQFSAQTEDGFFLIDACKDGKPILREGRTGDWIGTFHGHKGAVWGARLTTDATRAISASADFSAKLWNAVTGEVLHTWRHPHVVRSVDFAANNQQAVTGCHDGIIRVWDVNAYDPYFSVSGNGTGNVAGATDAPLPVDSDKEDVALVTLRGHTDAVRHLLWLSPDIILSSGGSEKDPDIRMWDLRTGRNEQSFVAEHPVTCLKRTADKESFYASSKNDVRVWNAFTFDLKHEVHTELNLACVGIHPNKEIMVCGAVQDLWVHVLDYETGGIVDIAKGHHGIVHCVDFSPDGKIYATGSEDGTVRLWQTMPGEEYGLWNASTPIAPATDLPEDTLMANDASNVVSQSA